MADTKISALPASTTPLAGTEVLPIVQSNATKKVATDDLTVKNIRSNATTGVLQISGPAAMTTRVMTTPDANFNVARTDAGQTFAGTQQFGSAGSGTVVFAGASQNASQATALNASNQLITYPYWPMKQVGVAGSNINVNFNSNVSSSWFVIKSDANNATIQQVSNLPGNGFLLTMLFDTSVGGTLTLLQGAGAYFRLKNSVDATVVSGNSMTFFVRANILFEISRNF